MTRRRLFAHVAVLVPLAVAVVGCGDDEQSSQTDAITIDGSGSDVGQSSDAAIDITAPCVRDEDCPGGTRCRDTECVPIDEIVCEPHVTRCLDERSLGTCNGDGTDEHVQTCDNDARCDTRDAVAACRPALCTPNEVDCLDATTAFACDATGTVLDELPCRDNQYCLDGTCRARVCEPGVSECDGNTVVTCDALGASASSTACAELAECVANGAGCACLDGACRQRVCVPDSARCIGNSAQSCSADGMSYLATVDCGDEQFCAGGRCISNDCVLDSRECSGDVLVACTADGELSVTDCADDDAVCTGTGATAACTPRVCEPESATCSADAREVIECDARGTSVTRRACDSDSYCDSGACVPRVCDPDEAATCIDGDRARCDELGASYEIVDHCVVGASNACCTPSCDAALGCRTTATSCGADVCSNPARLEIAGTCTGCGVNGAAGTCTGGRTEVCDASAGNLCRQVSCGGTAYRCTNAGGTWAWRTASACNDGNACTYGDTCAGAACTGTPLACVSDACSTRSCNGTAMCAMTVHTGAACDDGSVCTSNDRCTAAGSCVGTSPEPVCNRVPTGSGDLIFTEFMAKSRAGGSDLGEWFEMRNLTADHLTLEGCEFYDSIGPIAVAEVVVPPGTFVVFARSDLAIENGGVGPLWVYDDLVLNNTGDTLGLRCGTEVIDEVVYSADWVRDATTIQLADVADVQNVDANDIFANWCLASSSFGGGRFFGTPGRVADCP